MKTIVEMKVTSQHFIMEDNAGWKSFKGDNCTYLPLISLKVHNQFCTKYLLFILFLHTGLESGVSIDLRDPCKISVLYKLK